MTEYCHFHERQFKRKVANALDSVRRVLDVDRGSKIHIAGEVDHQYSDKYKLADVLTNTTIVAMLDVLKELGLTKEVIRSIDKSKETTLRFSTSESCKFVKTEVVEVPLPYSKQTQETTTDSDEFGTSIGKIVGRVTKKSSIEKIVERVTKDHYEIGMEWELSIYSGTDVNNRKILKERKVSSSPYVKNRPVHNKGEAVPPFPSQRDFRHKELSLTWLLQQIDAVELKSHFSIDTSTDNTQTKTPSRNSQIKGATSFFRSLLEWAGDVSRHYFWCSRSAASEEMGRLKITAKHREGEIFVPIFPLLEDQTPNAAQIQSKVESESESESWVDGKDEDSMGIEAESKPMATESESKAMASLALTNTVNDSGDTLSTHSPMLSVVDMMSFLHEHAKALGEMRQKLQEEFSERQGQLISSEEVMLIVFGVHSQVLVEQFLESISYIENLLEKQLVSAIGKKVSSRDLEEFMNYHNEQLFNPRPKRFCYTIRRPGHYPDGILSIEKEFNQDTTSKVESISTHVREVTLVDPIKVPLNAATTLALTGNTYLHGWMKHQFGSALSDSIQLNARARQFSSFVLVVGTMTNQNHLQPKNAIILRNKDEIHIPLLLNEIPTATEFKNSISSLSPEQQQFAESFRSMQLDSSVLGVCVIQIKPQLEKLLGLPKDSLTKEMKLTEDLMELFVEYQVPSDLVSCDFPTAMDVEGHVESNHQSVKDQVANVREHAKAVMDVIAAQKKEQLEEQEKKAEMAAATAFTKAQTEGEIYTRADGKKVRRVRKQSSSTYAGQGSAMMLQSASPALMYRRAAPSPPSPAYAAQGSAMMPHSASGRGRGGGRGGLLDAIQGRGCGGRGGGRGGLLDAIQGRGRGGRGGPALYEMAALQYCKEGGGEDDFAYDSMEQEEASEDQGGSLDHAKENNIAPSQKDTVVFAAMPKVLDKAIEFHDKNAAIRSTTIKTANSGWARIRQANLLSEAKKDVMEKDQIESEKSKAFDLLDALSRSGSLEIPFSELHVLICATHRFEKNVMETVIQDNINPIQKLEMSTLLMASTILGIPSRDLIQDETNRKRLETSFPKLLGGPSTRSS